MPGHSWSLDQFSPESNNFFTMSLSIRPQSECKYDLISLGEIMLRLDPGEGRIRTAREFKAWEGGGSTMLPVGCAAASD